MNSIDPAATSTPSSTPTRPESSKLGSKKLGDDQKLGSDASPSNTPQSSLAGEDAVSVEISNPLPSPSEES